MDLIVGVLFCYAVAPVSIELISQLQHRVRLLIARLQLTDDRNVYPQAVSSLSRPTPQWSVAQHGATCINVNVFKQKSDITSFINTEPCTNISSVSKIPASNVQWFKVIIQPARLTAAKRPTTINQPRDQSTAAGPPPPAPRTAPWPSRTCLLRCRARPRPWCSATRGAAAAPPRALSPAATRAFAQAPRAASAARGRRSLARRRRGTSSSSSSPGGPPG